MPLITLLTDFGADSSYAAEMKGVLYTRMGEQARIVDITHSITPQNILHGAVVWRETVPWFPDETVHVGVVDPGVGTERQLLAATFRTGNTTGAIICPDNGLASLIFDDFEITESVRLENRRYWNENISRTFHGRDILAPVAAAVTSGVSLPNLGPKIAQPIRLVIPQPIRDGRKIHGVVLYVDAFGNVITNILPDDIPYGVPLLLEIGEKGFPMRRVETYGNAERSTLVFLAGSSHRGEIAAIDGSAARFTGLRQGAEFCVEIGTT